MVFHFVIESHQERNPCQRSETLLDMDCQVHQQPIVTRREIRVNGLKLCAMATLAQTTKLKVTRREIRVNGLKLSRLLLHDERQVEGHQERNPCQRSET